MLNTQKLLIVAMTRWESAKTIPGMYTCSVHKAIFDLEEEPCWECHSECEED